LNISAGSWGPDNCYAYLQKYGDFAARIIFLVVSSHDAYDNMDFQPVVDVHPSFPTKQCKSAVYELVYRYLMPRLLKKKPVSDHITKGHKFNTGFEDFYQYAKDKHIPLCIYLHPDRKEVEKGEYDEQGQTIIAFCRERDILLLQGIETEDASCFRDGIHLNEKGQRLMAEVILEAISNYLKSGK
jgi:hypothetical protein